MTKNEFLKLTKEELAERLVALEEHKKIELSDVPDILKEIASHHTEFKGKGIPKIVWDIAFRYANTLKCFEEGRRAEPAYLTEKQAAFCARMLEGKL